MDDACWRCTHSQAEQHVLSHADLDAQAEQSVHAAQLQLVHQLGVQLVLQERQQVTYGHGVSLALSLLLSATQPEDGDRLSPKTTSLT